MEDTRWLFIWYVQTVRATMVVLNAYCELYIVYEAYMEGPGVIISIRITILDHDRRPYHHQISMD